MEYEDYVFNVMDVEDVGDTLYECNVLNTIYVGDIGDNGLFM